MLPTQRGFDDFYGLYSGYSGYSVNSYIPDQMIRLPAGRPTHTYKPSAFYATDAITDYAIDFVDHGRQDGGR